MECRRYFVHSVPFREARERRAYQSVEKRLQNMIEEVRQRKEGMPVKKRQKREHNMKDITAGLQECKLAALAYSILELRQEQSGFPHGKQAFEHAVPRDWSGSRSTKMRLLLEYAQRRLEPTEKMLVLCSSSHALRVARMALEDCGITSILLTRHMTEDSFRNSLEYMQRWPRRAVLLAPYELVGRFPIQSVARVLLLDFDFNQCRELRLLSAVTACNHVTLTQCLLRGSLEERCFQQAMQRRRERAVSLLNHYSLTEAHTAILQQVKQQPKHGKKCSGLRSVEGVDEVFHAPLQPWSSAGEEDGSESEAEDDGECEWDEEQTGRTLLEQGRNSPDTIDCMQQNMVLLHPTSLLVCKYVAVGSCVFGLRLNSQPVRWHLDPYFLLHTLFNKAEEDCLLSFDAFSSEREAVSAPDGEGEEWAWERRQKDLHRLSELQLSRVPTWILEQKIQLQLRCVNRPLLRSQLCLSSFPSSLRPLPESAVLGTSVEVCSLQLDGRQLLYLYPLFNYYGAPASLGLPSFLFPAHGYPSQEAELQHNIPSKWRPVPMNHLLQLLRLCPYPETATALFLSLLYRGTKSQAVYFYHVRTNLSCCPLLFVAGRHSLYILSCDARIQKVAAAALTHALEQVQQDSYLVHVPLYLGCSWWEQLELPAGLVRVKSKTVLQRSLSICYSLCLPLPVCRVID